VFATMGVQDRVEKPNTVTIGAVGQGTTVAADAGVQAGDRVVSVNGRPVSTVADFIKNVKASAGSPITLVVDRKGVQSTITVTPNADGKIGVALGSEFEVIYHKMGVLEAGEKAVVGTYNGCGAIVKGLGMMIGVVEKPTGLPEGASDVRGIVAIVQMGDVAWQSGIYSFLMLVVMVSFNLAVFNILPIPLLDGGHITFILIEKVIGRPVPVRIQNALTMLALFGLLSLFALGLFNDIFKPLKLK
jgi:regulator of sigma E protease